MNNKIFHNLSAAVAAGLALPYSKILKTREFSTQNKMNRLFAGKKRAVAELFILQQLLDFCSVCTLVCTHKKAETPEPLRHKGFWWYARLDSNQRPSE